MTREEVRSMIDFIYSHYPATLAYTTRDRLEQIASSWYFSLEKIPRCDIKDVVLKACVACKAAPPSLSQILELHASQSLSGELERISERESRARTAYQTKDGKAFLENLTRELTSWTKNDGTI